MSALRPKVCLVRAHQYYLVGHLAGSLKSSPAYKKRRRSSPDLVVAKFGGLLQKEARKATEIIPSNTCAAAGIEIPRENCPELGFRGTIYTVICIFKMLKLLCTNES